MLRKLKKKFEEKYNHSNLIDPRIDFPKNKFVIYTRGRTGSNLLSELINCHSEIYCDLEIFNFEYCKSRVRFPLMYINSCSKRATLKNKPVYGFKVKIAQLKLEHRYKNYEYILQRLNADGWKFIYLKRENFLRHQLSNYYAAETKTFHLKKSESSPDIKIKVDFKELYESVKFAEEIERTEEENLNGIRHLKLVYEKDLLDNSIHQKTADKVFDYLGLKSTTVSTEFKKITKENLEDIILNYDEVYRYFENTEYIKYFK